MAEKERKKQGRRKPKEPEKADIVATLMEESREAPEELRSYFPRTAEKLDRFLSPKMPSRERGSLFSSYLTERERGFRLNSLRSILQKSQGNGDILKEEATRALEDAAALREYAAAYKEALLSLLEKVLGFSLDAPQEKTAYFQKGKPEHHTYTLARGITLSLTWDGKLIKIVFDPKEFALRQKALSFVGSGSDTQSDVARRHDDYLGESLGQ